MSASGLRNARRLLVGAAAATAPLPAAAQATTPPTTPVAACAGALMGGSAFIACSHAMPSAPEQLCTYSWTLQTDAGLRTVQGYFDLLPGQTNRIVFQAGGVSAQIGGSVVLCQDALWSRPEPPRP